MTNLLTKYEERSILEKQREIAMYLLGRKNININTVYIENATQERKNDYFTQNKNIRPSDIYQPFMSDYSDYTGQKLFVISDYTMPFLNNIELLQIIKTISDNADRDSIITIVFPGYQSVTKFLDDFRMQSNPEFDDVSININPDTLEIY